MANSPYKGVQRLVKAGQFSWLGYKAAYQHEEAFRQEVWLLIVAIPLAFVIGNDLMDFVLLIGSIVLLLVVELLNSAIEAVVDRVGLEHHELSGRAKDMGSGAVLLTTLLVAAVWLSMIYEVVVQ